MVVAALRVAPLTRLGHVREGHGQHDLLVLRELNDGPSRFPLRWADHLRLVDRLGQGAPVVLVEVHDLAAVAPGPPVEGRHLQHRVVPPRCTDLQAAADGVEAGHRQLTGVLIEVAVGRHAHLPTVGEGYHVSRRVAPDHGHPHDARLVVIHACPDRRSSDPQRVGRAAQRAGLQCGRWGRRPSPCPTTYRTGTQSSPAARTRVPVEVAQASGHSVLHPSIVVASSDSSGSDTVAVQPRVTAGSSAHHPVWTRSTSATRRSPACLLPPKALTGRRGRAVRQLLSPARISRRCAMSWADPPEYDGVSRRRRSAPCTPPRQTCHQSQLEDFDDVYRPGDCSDGQP